MRKNILIISVIVLANAFVWSEGDKMQNPIVVEFPLRGEWLSPNTPGTKIPSHGANQYGTRYAYDFIQPDWNRIGYPAYRISFFRYLFLGAKLCDFYCWGQKVYAPFTGIVVAAEDGLAEREKTGIVKDFLRARKNASIDITSGNVKQLAGNYVIIKHNDNVYAALCHLKTGSIKVTVGQEVTSEMCIGEVGHSGNSYMPHLHFQLMDSANITEAKGLPCAFKNYEVFDDGKWVPVLNGIPTNSDRFRYSCLQ